MGHLGKPGTLFGSLTCRKIIKVMRSKVVLGIITVTSEEEIRASFGTDGQYTIWNLVYCVE